MTALLEPVGMLLCVAMVALLGVAADWLDGAARRAAVAAENEAWERAEAIRRALEAARPREGE